MTYFKLFHVDKGQLESYYANLIPNMNKVYQVGPWIEADEYLLSKGLGLSIYSEINIYDADIKLALVCPSFKIYEVEVGADVWKPKTERLCLSNLINEPWQTIQETIESNYLKSTLSDLDSPWSMATLFTDKVRLISEVDKSIY